MRAPFVSNRKHAGPFAPQPEMGMRRATRRLSLRRRARSLDDLAPLRDLAPEVSGELLRRRSRGLESLRRELLAQRARCERLARFRIQSVDDRLRRAGGDEE